MGSSNLKKTRTFDKIRFTKARHWAGRLQPSVFNLIKPVTGNTAAAPTGIAGNQYRSFSPCKKISEQLFSKFALPQ